MEFFCYHRDRPGSDALRGALDPEHWSYMDRFEAELIARGPTWTDDDVLAGSVHIVDLPDPAAARAFAFDEPNYQAGAFRDVMIRRWRNMLGRTMWEYTGGRSGFLVIGLGNADGKEEPLPAGQQLIAFGPLLSDDGATWLGTAVLLEAPDSATAREILTPDRYAAIEVYNWEFGGRR